MKLALSTLLRCATALAVAATFLSGCGNATDLDTEAAAGFQAKVGRIAEAADGKNYASALRTLKALEAEVEAAVADGSVSAAREQQIQQAIDLVRADLEQAREKSTPEVQPVPEPDDQEPEEEDWEEEELEEIEKDKGKGKDAGKGKKPGKIKDGEEFDD
jgi:hypothetical protein